VTYRIELAPVYGRLQLALLEFLLRVITGDRSSPRHWSEGDEPIWQNAHTCQPVSTSRLAHDLPTLARQI
jgi:hypothetical protein